MDMMVCPNLPDARLTYFSLKKGIRYTAHSHYIRNEIVFCRSSTDVESLASWHSTALHHLHLQETSQDLSVYDCILLLDYTYKSALENKTIPLWRTKNTCQAAIHFCYWRQTNCKYKILYQLDGWRVVSSNSIITPKFCIWWEFKRSYNHTELWYCCIDIADV